MLGRVGITSLRKNGKHRSSLLGSTRDWSIFLVRYYLSSSSPRVLDREVYTSDPMQPMDLYLLRCQRSLPPCAPRRSNPPALSRLGTFLPILLAAPISWLVMRPSKIVVNHSLGLNTISPALSYAVRNPMHVWLPFAFWVRGDWLLSDSIERVPRNFAVGDMMLLLMSVYM
ncbi:hypothetical protein DFH06DRAFT_1199062 [Mycena polygramma]|nr:hypothetical protein DFH06DRAFT_1199062 [Mycena polygramma]